MANLTLPSFTFKTKLLFLMLSITVAMWTFNFFTYRYQAASYLTFDKMLVMLAGIVLYVGSRNIKNSHPSLTFILESFWFIIITSVAITLFTIVIQYTPFRLQDALCQKWDMLLDYSVNSVVNWAYQFPHDMWFLIIVYNNTLAELFLAPLVLVLLQQRRQFDVFMISCLLTTIIGYLIYYFFPTSNPANVLQNPHFDNLLYSVAERFHDIHHHISNHNLKGGIIGFPSFHVIWICCITYAFRKIKWIFFPILILNLFIVIATLTTGNHFLVDILASFLIVFISIWIAEKTASQIIDLSFSEMVHYYKQEIRKS